MKVFLDANIPFSAAWTDGALRRMVLMLVKAGETCTNAHAVQEAERNLAAKAPGRMEALRSLLAAVPLEPGLADTRDVRLTDKDRPILGGAIAGRCTHLLTGDRRDFGALFGQAPHGVRIVTPRQLAEELAQSGRATRSDH